MEDANTTAVFKEDIDILGDLLIHFLVELNKKIDITIYHEVTARRRLVKLSTKTVIPFLSKCNPKTI